jgi:NAD(P)-dependent dehydrogenase (short-subunit alcohol dehydrogenase family)
MSTHYALVTGASTGIGHASAVALAEKGCHVFAGVRSEADGARIRLESGGKLHPILLDVTDAGQVAEALSHITSVVGNAGLSGLVNNAGIAVVGPLEFIPPEEFARQMNVNVNGLLAVTQAFIPLLRLAKGRLCLVSSTNGFLPVPFMGPYSASKFAVEALGDCLRNELAPWNIRVSLVEPGATRTAIWEKSKAENEALIARVPAECLALYGGMIDTMRGEAEKMVLRASPVEKVSDCVVHALTSRRPKTRYRCADGARMAWFAARWLPDTWRDWVILKAMGHIG